MLFLIGLIFTILIAIDYKITRSFYSPGFLNGITWLSLIILYQLIPHHYNALNDKFPSAILLWVVIFNLCSLFSFLLTTKSVAVDSYNHKIFRIEIWLSVIGTLILAFNSIKIAAQNPAYFFIYLRSLSTGLDEGVKMEGVSAIWGYARSGMIVVYLIMLLNIEKYSKRTIWIMLLLNLLTVLVTMAKSQLFAILFASAIIMLYKDKIRIKHILTGGLLFLILCLTMQDVRSAESDEVNANGFFAAYILSGSAAFDKYDSTSQPSHINTLRFFYAVTNSLGLSDTEAPPTILPYQSISNRGDITNVYTMLYPYYTDYGYVGVAVFAIILGLIFGSVFKKSNTNNFFKIIYSLISVALVFAFFGEILMSNLSTYIQYLIFAWLPYYTRNIRFKSRELLNCKYT